jgi:hypothetical protein
MLARRLEAEGERLIEAHRDRMALAWHVAALGRVKKLPSLKDVAADPRAPKRKRQSIKQMHALLAGAAKASAKAARQGEGG